MKNLTEAYKAGKAFLIFTSPYLPISLSYDCCRSSVNICAHIHNVRILAEAMVQLEVGPAELCKCLLVHFSHQKCQVKQSEQVIDFIF